MHKRSNLHNVREERLAGPGDDAQWRIDPLTVEFRDNGSGFYTFRGEASVVEHPYTVTDAFGDFTETIAAGAFDKTLRENPNVSFVYMHDMATVMASTRSGSLALSADPHLSVIAQLDKTDQDVQRFAPKALRGDANSMSFAFRVTRQEWNEDYTERRILEVNLNGGDVSAIVTGHGANPAAWGTMRAAELTEDVVLEWLQNADHATRSLAAGVLADQLRGDPDPVEVPQSIREDLAALYALGASLHPSR